MKTGKLLFSVVLMLVLCLYGAFAGGNAEADAASTAGFNATGYPVVDEQIQLTFAIAPGGQKD